MSRQYSVSSRTIPVEYGEIGILVLMGMLGGVCIYPSNTVTNFLIPEVLSSVAYSRAVGSALLLLSACQAVHLVSNRLRGTQSQKTINITFAFVSSVMIVLYGIFFSYIGFYIATSALVFCMSYCLDDENRSVKLCFVFTAITVCVVAGLFKIFKIYLPPALFL